MTLPRRIGLAALGILLACTAHAQAFPQPGRPVRIVVPFAAGGQTDIQARALAQRMSESMGGHPVIVENRPGASTVIGAREVQRAAPDGHTLLYTIAIHVQLPHLQKVPPFDPFKDFTPVTVGAKSGTVLTAHASMPFNTVAELVAYARANPGKLNFASFGAGTTSHLNGERFKRAAGIDLVHLPYKGSGDAMKDHLAGLAQLFFDGPTTAIANAKTGKVKMLATATSARLAALPDLPTMRETGFDVGVDGVLWFWGPAGMPATVLDAVYGHIARAVATPSIRELFAQGGSEATAPPPAEMARFARDLYERWGAVIREAGVQLD